MNSSAGKITDTESAIEFSKINLHQKKILPEKKDMQVYGKPFNLCNLESVYLKVPSPDKLDRLF